MENLYLKHAVSSCVSSYPELRIIKYFSDFYEHFFLENALFLLLLFPTNPGCPVVAGEPSAPKLEGHIGEDGNSIKVNVIKQDDGGSPIRHYLIKYKAVSVGLPRALGGLGCRQQS